MEEGSNFGSLNKNDVWLDNILENIKNLEIMLRNANEGCQNISEYAAIPFEMRQAIITDNQYKNLRLMLNEIKLLLTDCEVIIGTEKADQYFAQLKQILGNINERRLFVKETYSMTKGAITSAKMTELFYAAVGYVEDIRRNLIRDLSPIFFPKREEKKTERSILT